MKRRILLMVAVVLAGGLALWLLRPPPPDPQPAPAPAEGGDALVVTAVAPAGSTGRIAFALFDSAASFGGDAAAREKRFLNLDASGRATWRVEGLAPGRYAVKAYHDANANEELDKGAFGAPTEAYGFSRNARGRLGPPAWDDASFALEGTGLVLEITLR